METKTDNELIAEFMGIRVRYQGPVLYHCEEDGFIDWVDGADVYNPDRDWSDLMPVVEKIGLMSTGFHVNINTFDGCGIYDDQYRATGQGKSINSGINGTLIQVTYKAVVEFIKWYNQQKAIK